MIRIRSSNLLLTAAMSLLAVPVLLGTPPASAGGVKLDICHIPPGNPANAHTITVSVKAIDAHLDHGDFLGDCDVCPCVDIWENDIGGTPLSMLGQVMCETSASPDEFVNAVFKGCKSGCAYKFAKNLSEFPIFWECFDNGEKTEELVGGFDGTPGEQSACQSILEAAGCCF